MKESDFAKIEAAGFELGFQVAFLGTARWDKKTVKKAKQRLLQLSKRYLDSAQHSDSEGCIHCDSGEDIPSAFKHCPFCGVKLQRRL